MRGNHSALKRNSKERCNGLRLEAKRLWNPRLILEAAQLLWIKDRAYTLRKADSDEALHQKACIKARNVDPMPSPVDEDLPLLERPESESEEVSGERTSEVWIRISHFRSSHPASNRQNLRLQIDAW